MILPPAVDPAVVRIQASTVNVWGEDSEGWDVPGRMHAPSCSTLALVLGRGLMFALEGLPRVKEAAKVPEEARV